MSEIVIPEKQETGGIPAWVMTFADLMTLLMCFFVLILSFSEMDLIKYKQLAGSMSEAFGVQRDVKTKEPPKGINVVAREFSPGRPVPTPLNVVKQNTTDHLRRNLYVTETKKESFKLAREVSVDEMRQRRLQYNNEDDQRRTGQLADGSAGGTGQGKYKVNIDEEEERIETGLGQGLGTGTGNSNDKEGAGNDDAQTLTEADADRIRQALKNELDNDQIEILTEKRKIIIRIREKGSFPSGSATIVKSFEPVAKKIAELLVATPGQVVVSGHTDNIPIKTRRFRSNWELSASRAVTVVHQIMKVGDVDPNRFGVAGYGATKPIASNAIRAGRNKNRRVELMIVQGKDINRNTISVMRGNNTVIDQLLGKPAGTERKQQKKLEKQRYKDDDDLNSLLNAPDDNLDKLLWQDPLKDK